MTGEVSGETVNEVRRALAAIRLPESVSPESGPMLVALSGGRDSLVLLHLLRFHLRPPGGITALHVDHGMRSGSDADARWLVGLCRSWGVPLRVVRLDSVPRSEAEARSLRYRALRDEARASGARLVLVAHHAEDQAETILFRILRGTGPRGLAGIPPWRPLERGSEQASAPVLLVRPLLRVPGRQVEDWARIARLRPREDPTNQDLRFRRNRIRHNLLPRLEARSPGFRDALLALGDAARGRERALDRILGPALEQIVVAREENRISFARKRFLRYREPVRGELIRRLVREGGGSMGRKGLALALEFCASATSGREVTPAAGVRIVRDFDALALEFDAPRLSASGTNAAEPVGDRAPPLRLEGHRGEADFTPGPGRRFRISWRLEEGGPVSSEDMVPKCGAGTPAPGEHGSERGEHRPGSGKWRPESEEHRAGPGMHRVIFPAAWVEAPLVVRVRRPGDRVRLHLGPGPGQGAPSLRKLKKLMGEARVSRNTRDHLPLLVDAHGWVIWIPGVWRARVPASGSGPRTWTIGVIDANNFA